VIDSVGAVGEDSAGVRRPVGSINTSGDWRSVKLTGKSGHSTDCGES